MAIFAPLAAPPRPGTCVVCVCTDAEGCEAGCAWIDSTRTLCSLCADAGDLAERLFSVLGSVLPRLRSDRLPASWEHLTFEEQQLLTIACRRTAEQLQAQLIDEMGQDAVAALIELQGVMEFLQRTCPDQLTADETPGELIVRLLEPHVTKRVSLT